MLKRIGYAITALALTTFGVALAQTWPNLPIVGGSSYCGSTVNNACVSTIPAGPALSGTETIPADTNLSQGRSPQTAKIPVTSIGLGPTQWVIPLNGEAIPQTPYARRMQLVPAGTLAALTVLLQLTDLTSDGQLFGLCSTQTITALTVTAHSGTTLSAPAPTALTISTTGAYCYEWVYRSSNTTWYRVQ